MLSKAFLQKLKVDYVLMDSWFNPLGKNFTAHLQDGRVLDQ